MLHGNHSAALKLRYDRTGDAAALDEAIAVGEIAAEWTDREDPRLANRVSNLSIALGERYRLRGTIADLDESVRFARLAVASVLPGSPDRVIYLSNLVAALAARLRLRRDAADADEVVDLAEETLGVTPVGHANRAVHLQNLATALSIRYDLAKDPSDLDRAVEIRRAVMAEQSASVAIRIAAAQVAALDLVDRARARAAAAGAPSADAVLREGFRDALGALREAIALLPLLTWKGLGREDQQHLLEEHARSLGRLAAAAAVAAGEDALAVRLLEQSRGVLWGQLLDLRTDLGALRAAHPAIAGELEQCRSILDQGAAEHGPLPGPDREARVEAGRRFDELVGQVRALPATERFPNPADFLGPPRISALLPQAGTGPVVIVNVSEWRCDALVVAHGGVTSVPLATTVEDATSRTDRYLTALHRYTDPADAHLLEMATRPVLEWMWDVIAEPVLEHVDELGLVSGEHPRIWWCPTGAVTMLPVHAAGYHAEDDGRAVIDRVVSSYTPTLRVLAHASGPESEADDSKALAVAIAKTPGSHAELPGAASERRMLEAMLGPGSLSTLTDEEATREAIRAGLSAHQWVHIACHGIQNLTRPSEGGLVPYDWRTGGLVRVADLANLSSPGGRLAFLSACQTATGGIVNLDEAVNVAAAMRHAGWRHVIGTLWTVYDDAAADVAASFYGRILSDGRLDADGSARALHEAVRTLRSSAPQHTARWARFIHYGP